MLKYWLRYLVHLLRRYGTLVLAIVAVVVVVGLSIFWFRRDAFHGSVSEGVVGTYTDRDLPRVVTALMSRGLVKLDETGSPSADLAESWQAMNDAKEYLVKLKPGQKWVDGTPIKAQDIEASIPGVKTESVDDLTVKFILEDSFSPFMTLLDKPLLKKGTIIGVGPYRITDMKLSSVFLSRLNLVSEDPSWPNVTIRFYPNEKTARQALRIGEIQSILGLSDLGDLGADKTFNVMEKVNYQRIVAIFYNTKDKILSDENFRLALSYSAPEIVGQEIAVSSIQPHSWAFNPKVKDYLNNNEMAKAAWKNVENGKDQPLTLVTTDSLESIGEQVVDAWKKLGVNANLQVESGVPQNFQALLIAQDIPADPDQYSLWHSTQVSTNISKVALPRLDKALEDGRKEVDINKRKDIYFDFQKVLLDHSPATFLYFSKSKVVLQKKVKSKLEKVLQLQFGSF